MIIKSMSRKEPSFAQLYDYITRDNAYDHNYGFTNNFFHNDRDSILREFYKNASLLTNRKNGNYLYHEIISITRSKQISEDKQKQILQQLVYQYAQSRAKDCLIFGGLHDEKENNLHFHLIISANKLNQNTRYRLSQVQFDGIKKGLEKYCLDKYPELEQKHLISKKRNYADNKQKLKDSFKLNAEISANQTEFLSLMEQEGFIYYKRGQTDGFKIKATGKKHRLKTLDLSEQFNAISSHSKPDNKNDKRKTKPTAKKTSNKKKAQTSTLKRTVDEFVFGDFTELDKETTKAKYRKQNEQDAKVVDEADRSFTDKLEETAKEWLQGDFSHREARARNKKSEQNLKKWRQVQTKSKENNKQNNKKPKK